MSRWQELPHDVEKLFAAATDGQLSDDDLIKLEALLVDSPHLQQLYTDYCQLAAEVRIQCQGERALNDALQNVEALSAADTSPTPSKSRLQLAFLLARPKTLAISIAALVLAIIVTTMAVLSPPGSTETQHDPHDFIAKLTHTRDAVWATGQTNNYRGANLRVGQRLELKSGQVDIAYHSGAQVLLEGPAVYEVLGVNEGYLHRGSLVGRVTLDSAKGFTVETPFARVEDQGTEFGIEVVQNGAAVVLVLKGKVDFVRESSGNRPEQRVSLTKDQSASIKTKGGAFARHGKIDVQLAKVMRSRLEAMQASQLALARIVLTNPDFNSSLTGWTDVNGNGTDDNYGITLPGLPNSTLNQKGGGGNYVQQGFNSSDEGAVDASTFGQYTLDFHYGYRRDSATNGDITLRIALWNTTDGAELAFDTLTIADPGVGTNSLTAGSVNLNYDNTAAELVGDAIALRITHTDPILVPDNNFSSTSAVDNLVLNGATNVSNPKNTTEPARLDPTPK